jgi:hypothetical protein
MGYLARKKQTFAAFIFSTGLQAFCQRQHRCLQVFIFDSLCVALECFNDAFIKSGSKRTHPAATIVDGAGNLL